MVILIILCDFSQQSYFSLNGNFHSEKFWAAEGSWAKLEDEGQLGY